MFSLPVTWAVVFILWLSVFTPALQSDRLPKVDVQTIEFREFFDSGMQELKPSARLLGLDGARVRLVGFMAHLEEAPEGAFYLCSRPVYGDESGGGTADLPVETVRVIVRSAKGKKIPFIGRAIEVTGILEIGNRTEDDATVSAIRLILDGPQSLSTSQNKSTTPTYQIRKPKISSNRQRRK